VATTALIAWFKNKETDLQARALEVARVMATAPGDVRQAYQELRASEGYRKDQGFLDSLLSKGSSMFGVVVALVAVALMIDVGKLFKGRAASREPVENPVGGRCAMIEENPPPGYVVPPSRGGRKGGVYWSHDPRKRKRQAAYIQDWIDRATTDAYIEYYRPGKRVPVRISQEVPF
jgi:hypothetical protein